MIEQAKYAIECIDIRKAFGSVEALRGVSLNAKPGEVTAIVGDNGAGKSTLIKCISGVYTPDSGTIKIAGSEVSFTSPEESREFGIETVYQTLSLIEDLSIWQNLYLNREIVRSFGPIKTRCPQPPPPSQTRQFLPAPQHHHSTDFADQHSPAAVSADPLNTHTTVTPHHP